MTLRERFLEWLAGPATEADLIVGAALGLTVFGAILAAVVMVAHA